MRFVAGTDSGCNGDAWWSDEGLLELWSVVGSGKPPYAAAKNVWVVVELGSWTSQCAWKDAVCILGKLTDDTRWKGKRPSVGVAP